MSLGAHTVCLTADTCRDGMLLRQSAWRVASRLTQQLGAGRPVVMAPKRAPPTDTKQARHLCLAGILGLGSEPRSFKTAWDRLSAPPAGLRACRALGLCLALCNDAYSIPQGPPAADNTCPAAWYRQLLWSTAWRHAARSSCEGCITCQGLLSCHKG